MSATNKSLDKNKRFTGIKANDFVNKTRTNEANRSASRPQGWANLGKINSRRIPPPANLPSLKSETGVNSPTFDPTVTTNHSWTSNENQSSIIITPNPTQQQIDSLPVSSLTPPPSQQPPQLQAQPLMDIDKPRIAPTWSTITSGTNPNEHIPSLLPLNDFPRLATTPDRKSHPEPIANVQSPSFRPANIATWKEGGSSSRVHDMSQMIPNNPGANLYQQQLPNPNMRMYPLQMWAYNPYQSVSLPMHQQPQQSMNTMHEYKSPTILRHKDIDDLSKLTDNTWANSTQEVNYEEKIRFSDDEDENNHHIERLDSNIKTRRMNPQVLQHSRLIQDDEHVKQMQDNKNSELMNALNIAKQRRDEQERNLKNEQLNFNNDEQKQMPGYQTRPLLNTNDQENLNSPTLWQSNKETSRTRHDTANSQSSFAMKSWSDQMDSFNYSSLHEKSRGHADNDDSPVANKYNHSQSGSSSPSHFNNDSSTTKKSKKVPLSSKKQQKPSIILSKTSAKRSQRVDNQPRSNEQLDNFDDSMDNNRYQQHSNDNRYQLQSDGLSAQKPNRMNKQSLTKTHTNERQQTNSRTKQASSSKNSKPQPVWRQLSPNHPNESTDSMPQESVPYKSQQRSNLNDHKQRYQTAPQPLIDTSSIPPLMSVRSDATATANLYKSAAHYDEESMYYNSSLDMHQNYHHTNLHNRGYTTLGSYGRYRRGGTVRHQQQYASYNINNTSGVSSAPNTSSGTRQKKNSSNRTNSNKSVKTPNEEVSIPKLLDTPIVLPSSNEVLLKGTEKSNDTIEQKSTIKNDNEANSVVQTENESSKTAKNTTIVTSSNSKKRTNKNQQNYNQDQNYQSQQAPRHRNNYSRVMQDYDNMQMTTTHNYYGTNRRSANNSHNTHMHDLSSGYYYEHPKQHYNNRYNYSNENYQKKRPANKNSKRISTSAINNRQPTNGSNNNNRHHSTSDNDQKEGEEWETASESSTNMRNDHYDTNAINSEQTNETKSSNHRGRTPPKKSFSSQRPNARQILKYTNA